MSDNVAEAERDSAFRRILAWGLSMVMIGPISTWSRVVRPSWL